MIALLYLIILGIDGCWVSAVLIATFLVLFIPWFTYSFLRSPVLEGIWRTWPPFMNKWFEGLADDLDTHWSFHERSNESFHKEWNAVCNKLCHILQHCRYFPPFCEKWDAVYWSPQGSPRDSLLRAAINEKFRIVGEEEISWHHKSFRNWLLYWCAPVWGSYIALLLLLIPQACNCSDQRLVPQSKTLYFLVWIWILFGAIFIWREKSALFKWSGSNQDNQDYVPSLIYRYLKDVSEGFLILSETSVKLILSFIGAAGISAYISLVNILYPMAVEVKNTEPIKVIMEDACEESNNTPIVITIFNLQSTML